MRQSKSIVALAGALLFALALTGCGDNPLEPPINNGNGGGGGRDTIVIITPPDSTCPTCPPDTCHIPPPPCPTCPPDTVPPPPPPSGGMTYTTAGGRIHEAQSHATLVTNVIITSRSQTAWLTIPIKYESGKSQQNENFHVYFRDVSTFTNKWDMVYPPTGTQVVPDPAGFSGTLVRQLTITGLPPATYEVVIQQDLPNHHSPGESDIDFGAGTLVVAP